MYDLIIIGGGPAGFTAALYASRYRIKTMIISEMLGGQIIDSPDVENYPGIKLISGLKLMQEMQEQAEHFEAEVKNEKVDKVENKYDHFLVNEKYQAKNIILSLGMKRRKLNTENEEKFAGKGISYCATCDGPFFKDKVVGVVGGSDSACEAALLLSQYAKKVYIIYRRDKLRAEPITVEKIEKDPKIETVFNRNVVSVDGSNFLEKVKLDNGDEMELNGLFIEIGYEPQTDIPKMLGVDIDQNGLIKVDAKQETNVENVFAAGDCTNSSNQFNQIITAASEGAIAANSAYNRVK